MKTLTQHLKQAFNALEFASAGHLHALTAKLNQSEHSASTAWTEQQNESTEPDTRSTTFTN